MTANNKKLFSIFLIVFIDLLGFSIILPSFAILCNGFWRKCCHNRSVGRDLRADAIHQRTSPWEVIR